MKSLASKEPPYGKPVMSSSEPEEKVHYPSTTLHNDQVDVLGKKIPKVGSTGKAHIRYKVTRHEDGQDGKHLSMDITHMEPHDDSELNEKDFED